MEKINDCAEEIEIYRWRWRENGEQMNINIRPTSSNILFCLSLENIIIQGMTTIHEIN